MHSKAWNHVAKTVNQIERGARILAPKGNHQSGSGAKRPGLPLARSIFSRIDSHFDLITGRVGSFSDHAATVHQGSKPHTIRMKGKMLKFEWERGRLLVQRRSRGRRAQAIFFFKKVNHPGNKRPVRYLTTPMHQYGRANGFRTSSQPVARTRLP